ncbi:MAG: hypothetical protein ACM31C_03040 [Acidobacteriota bacterium]
MAKRRKRRKAPDDGDFAIQLNPIPGAPNPTMELETADLANMEQSGEAIARPNLVIQLESGKTVELGPGWSHGDHAPKVIVADEVLGSRPAVEPPRQQPIPLPRKDGGAWLVVFVYLLATAALAAAIYERYLE